MRSELRIPGTTQSSTGRTDSANYTSFEEMLAAYQADIAEVQAGDITVTISLIFTTRLITSVRKERTIRHGQGF